MSTQGRASARIRPVRNQGSRSKPGQRTERILLRRLQVPQWDGVISMRIAQSTSELKPRDDAHKDAWRWTLVDEHGVGVDRGLGRDEAAARRHARRSALLRGGSFTIIVSEA